MEFGIFLNGYIPGPAAHQTELEHVALSPRGRVRDLRRQAQLEVRLAGRAPQPHRVLAHVGPRGRDGVHRLADGLHPPLHRHQQPARHARSTRCATPRAAMLDHFTNDRFEWGTGHGAGSHELASFNIHRQDLHQGGVGRGRPGDPTHVGAGRLLVRRRALHGADPHNMLPEAVRQGSPADLGRVRQPADVRQGRRARHRRHRVQLRAHLQPDAAASRPTRRASRSAPTRSASSRTTT